jgi:two-component system chemotaxis response regulator CheY
MTAVPLHDLRPKILVVDADVDSHLLYTDALGFDEREITYALDGRDALVKALAYPFALVITESRLPYIDGYALCEILRRDSATRTTPIIVVTTDSRPASVQRARQAGADAVLVKPFRSDVLCADAQRLMLDSDERQAPTGRARLKLAAQRDRSTSLVALGSGELKPRRNSRAHKRYTTTRPPMAPAAVRCPSCDRSLDYESSQIGGVSAVEPEQWDYYSCPAGCGRFQYRPRTRKLRMV